MNRLFKSYFSIEEFLYLTHAVADNYLELFLLQVQSLYFLGALPHWLHHALLLFAILGAGVVRTFGETWLVVLIFLDVHVYAVIHIQIS
jgi:hypothetical protein